MQTVGRGIASRNSPRRLRGEGAEGALGHPGVIEILKSNDDGQSGLL